MTDEEAGPVTWDVCCSNGLIVGTTLLHLKQQHRQQLQVEELGRRLREAVQSTAVDISTFQVWMSKPIDAQAFVDWIDKDVRERWGVKAAVRALSIVTRGSDVEPIGDVRNRNPSEVETKSIGKVPGIDGPVRDLFGVSQVLAWIAGQRSDMAEDLEWRTDVPELIDTLAKRTKPVNRKTF